MSLVDRRYYERSLTIRKSESKYRKRGSVFFYLCLLDEDLCKLDRFNLCEFLVEHEEERCAEVNLCLQEKQRSKEV